MKFRNIHNRNEFKKLYEFGAAKGGVGDNDGFANNLPLKDTLLGKLFNGLFRGISWLWRKSKENFIINRLIAKLINELMRGIIIFCFENNINLETGIKQLDSNKVKVVDDDKDEKTETDVEGEELEDTEIGEEGEGEGEGEGEEKEGEEGEEEGEELEIDDIGDKKIEEFDIVKNDIPKFDPENPSKEILKKLDIPEDIKSDDASHYDIDKKNMYNFLNKNIKNYSKMLPEEKQKIKNIYITYKIIDSLNKQKITESLNEAFIKPKLSNTEAGKVKTKVGASINVGNILTKKDKDKYKDHQDEFKVNIKSINLAEIEKYVENSNQKSNVSSYVNPESLKTIQLTAEELFLSPNTEKDSGNEKSKLQLKWNKELTKVYSSFTNIMDISMVDIRREFRSDLDNKMVRSVKTSVNKLGHMVNTNKIADDFEKGNILDNKDITFSELQGRYAYFSFTCKNLRYISTIQNIFMFTKKNKRSYLIKVANTFESIDISKNELKTNFKNFKNEFAMKPNYNVFFLFNNPRKDSNIRNKMLLFNEDPINNVLYLCKLEEGGNILVFKKVEDIIKENDGDISKTLKKYIIDINIVSLKLFSVLNNDWKQKFNFNFDYIGNNVPAFYTKFENIISKINEKMRE